MLKVEPWGLSKFSIQTFNFQFTIFPAFRRDPAKGGGNQFTMNQFSNINTLKH